MIDSFDNTWWNDEKTIKEGKKKLHGVSDSELFQLELSKIEEALENISYLIRKYMEEEN
jgi:hypothetical protein